jgi:rubrerythrin
MEIIKQLVEKIDDELEDAEKYIKLACKMKDKDKVLADVYYNLSIEEMGHMTKLHDQVVRIINDFKKTSEVPIGMQTLYDYLHERQIKWATKIKSKQDMYKY